jgi:hypothetical protein
MPDATKSPVAFTRSQSRQLFVLFGNPATHPVWDLCRRQPFCLAREVSGSEPASMGFSSRHPLVPQELLDLFRTESDQSAESDDWQSGLFTGRMISHHPLLKPSHSGNSVGLSSFHVLMADADFFDRRYSFVVSPNPSAAGGRNIVGCLSDDAASRCRPVSTAISPLSNSRSSCSLAESGSLPWYSRFDLPDVRRMIAQNRSKGTCNRLAMERFPARHLSNNTGRCDPSCGRAVLRRN